MSPDTIRVHDGHASVARYQLSYEIKNPEKANKAFISIYAPGVGEVQKFDVDVQPSAQIEFLLDASNYDLGPTVRFRVRCRYGDTEWYVMGSDPPDAWQSQSSRKITGLYPGGIPARGQMGGGVPITISGPQFNRNCTPEAQVDFSTVDLQNVVAVDRRITAVLPSESLQGRPVTTRHLEVKLVVNGPGMAVEDIYNLNFVE